ISNSESRTSEPFMTAGYSITTKANVATAVMSVNASRRFDTRPDIAINTNPTSGVARANMTACSGEIIANAPDDFGFWILDYGLVWRDETCRHLRPSNPKSKI